MSNTFGQPNFTASNTAGKSGINPNQVGYIGDGVLGTIEESAAAFNSSSFYNDKSTAFFKEPSVQRSHGDQIRTFSQKGFGSKTMLTLPRNRDFWAPYSFLQFDYPINYGVTGNEFMLETSICGARSTYQYAPYGLHNDVGDASKAVTQASYSLGGGTQPVVREKIGCSPLLPTHFWSGGVGFAFFSAIELSLGGAGQQTIDRYSNWMMIMASCPTTRIRQELMIMAGGGYADNLETFEDIFPKPFSYGWFRCPNVGLMQNFYVNSIEGGQGQNIAGNVYLPIMAHCLVPIRTPNLSFWQPFIKKKPIDSSIMAGDFQITLTLGNFYEFSDTGTGKNVYSIFKLNTDNDYAGIDDAGSTPITTSTRLDDTVNQPDANTVLHTPNLHSAPIVWANHYRVCDSNIKKGPYGEFDAYNLSLDKENQVGNPNVYVTPYFYNSTILNSYNYPQQFSEITYINSSFKLTNPTLGARSALESAPNGSVLYPYQYGFNQTYRIPTSSNPYGIIKRLKTSSFSDLSSLNSINDDRNKITQMITMPANPTTTMLISVFREMDRKYLGKNAPNTYSPALFWNALELFDLNLMDGGNILFQYKTPCDHSFYSMSDKIGCFKIPFRGGLCQLHPDNLYGGGIVSVDGPKGVMSFLGNVTVDDIQLALPFTPLASCQSRCQRYNYLHSTEVYNAHIYEIPFCLNSIWSNNEIPQQTPSFSKTQLKLEFKIHPFLKPRRQLDDMYDQTYVIDNYVNKGLDIPNTATKIYDGTIDTTSGAGIISSGVSVPDVYGPINAEAGCNYRSYWRELNGMASKESDPMVESLGSINPSSWNINSGSLMIVVTFMQNQLWQLGMFNSKTLGARG